MSLLVSTGKVAEETSGEDMISFSNTNLLDDLSSVDDLQGLGSAQHEN